MDSHINESVQNIQSFIPGESEQVVSVGRDILGSSSPFILPFWGDVFLPRAARAPRSWCHDRVPI
jgi:hypothetical protein